MSFHRADADPQIGGNPPCETVTVSGADCREWTANSLARATTGYGAACRQCDELNWCWWLCKPSAKCGCCALPSVVCTWSIWRVNKEMADGRGRDEWRVGLAHGTTWHVQHTNCFVILWPVIKFNSVVLVAYFCQGLEAESTAKPQILSYAKSRPAVYRSRPWGRRTCLCRLKLRLCKEDMPNVRYVHLSTLSCGRLCTEVFLSEKLPDLEVRFWATTSLMILRCGTVLEVQVGVQSCCAAFGRSTVQVTAFEDELCAVYCWTCWGLRYRNSRGFQHISLAFTIAPSHCQ